MTTHFDNLPEKEKVERLIIENQRLRKQIEFLKGRLEDTQGEIDRLDREELMGT